MENDRETLWAEAWERDTDCESESLKSRDDADTAMQDPGAA